MADKGWLKRFDEPILLDDGTKLETLRDAIHYLAKTVPKAEREHEKVLTASDHLSHANGPNGGTAEAATICGFTPGWAWGFLPGAQSLRL